MNLFKFLKFWHSPKKIWITTLLILIGVGGYFLYPKPKAIPVEVKQVTTGEVKELISTSGTLEGTDSASLHFRIPGKLNNITVKPGDRVLKGSLMASLDTRDLQVNLQKAYNSFEIKDSTAKRAEDDVKDNSNDENFTQKEDRTAAQKARDSAFDDIKAAKRALEDAFIYAPLSGVVIKADPNIGEIVTAADLIAQIVDESEYVFEAEVDESDLGRIKIGQSADVTLNSYPNQIFKATVSKVTPTTQTTDSGATVVIVKLDLGQPQINFVAGLNGQAEITTAQVNNTLTIPTEALMDSGEVYIKKGDSYEKVKVETGLKSDTTVEIKSGLYKDASVVTNPEAIKTSGNSFKFPGT